MPGQMTHTKEYGVYLWDTFDNETMLLDEFDDKDSATAYIQAKFGDRVSSDGADRVEIVDSRGGIVDFVTIC